MFLPRKLQKRTHSSRTTPHGSAEALPEVTPKDEDSVKPQSIADADKSAPVDQATPSGSTSDGNYAHPVAFSEESVDDQYATQSSAGTIDLEGLVEFLYIQLSPLTLALGAVEERRKAGSGPYSDLIANITTEERGLGDDKGKAKDCGSTTHLARLLVLIPGLSTRCKSIIKLSYALAVLRAGPAAGWFNIHIKEYQVEWSQPFSRAVNNLLKATEVSSLLATLAPLLIYVESVPPRYQTRARANDYIAGLVRGLITLDDMDNLCDGLPHSGANRFVMGVLEPSVVERQLMTKSSATLSASSILDKRWISGRGFFLLDSQESVEILCAYRKWELAERVRSHESPIRCLSWAGWVEMKKLYLEEQQRARGDLEDVQGKRKRSTSPAVTVAQSGSPFGDEEWFRGTMLLLDLPLEPKTPHCIRLPLASSIPDLTPTFFSRHLKPQLEKQVAESVSYIHVLSSFPSSQRSDVIVAIRTTHSSRATQLLAHFPELTMMDADEEEKYWADLPVKVCTAAKDKMLALDRKLSTQ